MEGAVPTRKPERKMANESQLKALSEVTGGNLYDAEWQGGTWMIEAVQTHETIEQFIESSVKWTERSTMKRGTIAGMPCVVWDRVQAHHGQPRRSMAVIDFGDIRFAVSDWMSES